MKMPHFCPTCYFFFIFVSANDNKIRIFFNNLYFIKRAGQIKSTVTKSAYRYKTAHVWKVFPSPS